MFVVSHLDCRTRVACSCSATMGLAVCFGDKALLGLEERVAFVVDVGEWAIDGKARWANLVAMLAGTVFDG